MLVTVAKRSQVTVKIAKHVGENTVIAQAMSAHKGVRAQGKIENGDIVACVFNDADSEWKGNVCWIAL